MLTVKYSILLKGLDHAMNFCWRPVKKLKKNDTGVPLRCVLSVPVLMDLKFLICLVKRKNYKNKFKKILLVSLKTLTNVYELSWSLHGCGYRYFPSRGIRYGYPVYISIWIPTFTIQVSLKVPSGQIGSAWEWYHWKAL